ncbi:MAG TPA: type II toxin-antitoxin system prevent-host-death family antitoxin [Terracidiphilus sp.]|nr:type II toxin-antitoxin system prevent-host-death family antitoxin [Terracidiphilus sp.]
MMEISATKAKQQFAALLEAAQRGPVRIQRHGRDVAVLVSATEHEQMVKERWREFDRLSALAAAQAEANGLTEEKLQEILADR